MEKSVWFLRCVFLITSMFFSINCTNAVENYESRVIGKFGGDNVVLFYYFDGRLDVLSIGHRLDEFELYGGKDIYAYRNALKKLRDKYAEWIEVAKVNNVKDLRKTVDIVFPKAKGISREFRQIEYEFVCLLDHYSMYASIGPSFYSIEELDELIVILDNMENEVKDGIKENEIKKKQESLFK